jgi:hypothetical protein
MQMMDTGYKQDGLLGALYGGYNNANVETANELEMVRNFLANQREQQAQPVDQMIKELQGQQAKVQNTPEMLRSFVDAAKGRQQSDTARGAFDTFILPTKQKAEKERGIQQFNDASQANQITEIENKIAEGGNPIQMAQYRQLRDVMTKLAADNPKHRNKMDEIEAQGGFSVKNHEISAEASKYAADQRLEAALKRQEQAQHDKTLSYYVTQINNLNTNLTKIDGKEAEQAIFQQLLARNGKAPTNDEVAAAKHSLKADLIEEKRKVQQAMAHMREATGIPAPAETGNVIKLD